MFRRIEVKIRGLVLWRATRIQLRRAGQAPPISRVSKQHHRKRKL